MNHRSDLSPPGPDIAELGWPLQNLGAGMEALARRQGLEPAADAPLRMPPQSKMADAELSRWVEWAGRKLGIEAEPIQVTFADFDTVVRNAHPAIVQLASDRGPVFLLLIGSSKRHVQLLGPDLKPHRCTVWDLKHALSRTHEQPLREELDRVLELATLD